jgi:hypothetical protein
LLPDTRDLGSKPLGDLCETGILLLALLRYKGMFMEEIAKLLGRHRSPVDRLLAKTKNLTKLIVSR